MMLRANSTFGVAPDCLKPFRKADDTPGKAPKIDRWLNRRHSTDNPLASDPPTKEITRNHTVTNDWEEYLRDVGEQFRDVRASLGMSLGELHSQTLVPIAHLQALETGCIETLPTAVYVRGFIRKIGKALGLDGDLLAESLPQQDSLKTVLPSWQRLPDASKKISFRLPLLYMSYCSLMMMSIFWLQRQENTTQTQLEQPEISEIQPNLSAEEKVSAQR